MNDVERWIYIDGPEPERYRSFLSSIRDLPPPTPEHKAREARRCLEAIGAMPVDAGEAEDAEEEEAGERERAVDEAGANLAWPPLDAERVVVSADGATVRSPTLDQPTQASPVPELGATALPAAPAVVSAPGVDGGPDGGAPQPHGQVGHDGGPPRPAGPVVQRAPAALLDTAPSPGLVDAALRGMSFPALDVKQYASLCVELTLWPAQTAATLHKYQITQEAHAALDAHWRGKFAMHPELLAQFDQARTEYLTWLRARRG